MKPKFPRTNKRQKRNDEFRADGIIDKIRRKREMKKDGEWKEKKREDKQVDRLAKVRKMESKGNTESNRYKKLKEKVYNPFPENPPKRKDAIKKFKKAYTDKNRGDLREYNNENSDPYETGRKKNAGGGIMSMPMGQPRVNQGGVTELDYRAKGGFVPVGIKEKADDVPAMLSKNEFVMTADAVRAAGGGSVNEGAKRMYDVMNKLEARA